jgi:hypothetical protein
MHKKSPERQLLDRVHRVASLATSDNPVSVMHLRAVREFARAQLIAGESEASAVLKTAEFIRSLDK